MKGIFAKAVQQGDIVIRYESDRPILVERVDKTDGNVRVYAKGRCQIFAPGQIVGLVHRPWPEGEKHTGLLLELERQLSGLTGVHFRFTLESLRKLPQLREALDAHELGKPQESPVMHNGEVGPGFPPDAMPLG